MTATIINNGKDNWRLRNAARLYLATDELEFAAVVQEEKERADYAAKVLTAAKIAGYQIGGSDHSHDNVAVTAACAHLLDEKGIARSQIRTILGKNYSSIYHYKRMIDDWYSLPKMYERELHIMETIKQEAEKL